MAMTSKHRPGLLAAILPLALVLLTACAPVVALDPAADATNPKCADIIVRLPSSVASQPQRETNAQATAAWGDPASILLHCGVAVPGPSTLLCVTVSGIDWLYDPSGAPNYVFITFGRDPATQVVVNGDKASGTSALSDLANAVGSVKATHHCTDPDDVLGQLGPSPSPSPSSSPSATP
jgi:hypothetical protein